MKLISQWLRGGKITMDFLMEQALLYSSEKYAEIYRHFNQKLDMKYQDLFIVCASIGFKNDRKSTFEKRSRELRTNFFNTNQKAIFYSIVLSDPELGRDIERFDEREFKLNARKLIELYAEGGMDILVEEVFGSRWDGYKLDETYNEYEVDVLGYIYNDAQSIPF